MDGTLHTDFRKSENIWILFSFSLGARKEEGNLRIALINQSTTEIQK